MIWYFTPYITGLNNGYKLPIIFFDACLTAKLDFNFTDLQNYFPRTVYLLTRIFKLSEDPSMFYPCFAGILLTKEDGGAIATIGSTRTASGLIPMACMAVQDTWMFIFSIHIPRV
jgi:hypothetical protein